MSLCTCITMPQPPGVSENEQCVADYNSRNSTNCTNFLTACQSCGEDQDCQRAARDLYLQACLGSLYQLTACLDAKSIPAPNTTWDEWGDDQLPLG